MGLPTVPVECHEMQPLNLLQKFLDSISLGPGPVSTASQPVKQYTNQISWTHRPTVDRMRIDTSINRYQPYPKPQFPLPSYTPYMCGPGHYNYQPWTMNPFYMYFGFPAVGYPQIDYPGEALDLRVRHQSSKSEKDAGLKKCDKILDSNSSSLKSQFVQEHSSSELSCPTTTPVIEHSEHNSSVLSDISSNSYSSSDPEEKCKSFNAEKAKKSNSYVCDICSVSFRAPLALERHYLTKAHLRKVQASGLPDPAMKFPVYLCTACDLKIVGYCSLKQHYATAIHKKMVNISAGKPNATFLSPVPYPSLLM